ncbi:unnamed protein product [Prorocentrum cordatum]|uniref:Uncharacterized protein n=1 Tax=Prorocentrum cordatum TaxID=2364126 RepID=A0ABN9SQH4_9DINO|nr:unnamed protein product [Polarella glacialis]
MKFDPADVDPGFRTRPGSCEPFVYLELLQRHMRGHVPLPLWYQGLFGMFSVVSAAASSADGAAPQPVRGKRGAVSAGYCFQAKKTAQRTNNRTVPRGFGESELFEIGHLRMIGTVLMTLVLNLSTMTRHQEAITTISLIGPESAAPVGQAKLRVRGWVEAAQDFRSRGEDGEVDKLGSISVAALVGLIKWCESANAAASARNQAKLTACMVELNGTSLEEVDAVYPFRGRAVGGSLGE